MPEQARRRAGGRGIGSKLLVAVLVGALGFVITLQVGRDRESVGYSSMRGVELVELLRSVDAANERLTTQIDDLSRTRDDLLASQSDSTRALQEAEQRADQLAVLAGSVGAEGPGIRMRITDSGSVVDSGLLLDAVEELRAAGAEAIVINGSARVVAQTYFLDDDGAVRVGGREVSPPYVLEAIGDPATLQEAMSFRGGIVDRLEGRGARASVRDVDRITITALADVKSPEYARPDVETE